MRRAVIVKPLVVALNCVSRPLASVLSASQLPPAAAVPVVVSLRTPGGGVEVDQAGLVLVAELVGLDAREAGALAVLVERARRGRS